MQEPDQYLLDLPELQERDLPTLDNFVVGANAEVVAVLREMAQGSGPKFLYLYGPQGCGLTHLLKAVNPGNGTSCVETMQHPLKNHQTFTTSISGMRDSSLRFRMRFMPIRRPN